MMETQQCVKPAVEKESTGNRTAPRLGKGGVPPPPGRPKGVQNRVTRTIREAVEMAAKDCHPAGLAGWLVDRANGTLGDRQIFAAMVAKALPLQVNANVTGGITISMPWLGQRGVAGATVAQLDTRRAQIIDATDVQAIEHRITDAALGQGAAPPGAHAGQAPGSTDGNSGPTRRSES